MFKKLALAGSLVVGSALSASAATMDFTGMTAAVTAEITPAVTAALPIAGTILACGIAVKLYKRFVK